MSDSTAKQCPNVMPPEALDFDLFKDFPEPVFVMTPDGTILAANRFFSSRFESLHEQLAGCNVFELLAEIKAPDEVIANRRDKTGEVLRTGKHVAFDDPMDGDIWRSSIYPVFGADGSIVTLLVMVQNVTKQRLAETANENFRATMDFALESSHVSVWWFDLDHDILKRTIEHDRIFGYHSLVPDWKIERFFGHIHHDDLPAVMRVYDASMSNRSDFNIEFRIRRVDEEIRWVNLVGTFRFTKQEPSRYIVGVIIDVTEKKLAALKLEQLQAQLLHAQKMELLGQLAGGIAHDFNNSLAAIIGNLELALNKIDPSHPTASNLRNAHASAMRSAQLTSQLLGFARKQIALPKALSLNQEVQSLVPMLKPLIGSQIECVWLPCNDNPLVFIDPGQLDQVLSNLCINARDAIEEHGTITISTCTARIGSEDCAKGHPCQLPGNYTVLSVSDTGSGIDLVARPHIFEPFFTTKPLGKGTGLGLSTVYGIVTQNNGFIDIQTEPGKGATFSVYLPLYQTSEKKSGEKRDVQCAGRKNGTVLLVEDEPNILNILMLALETKGFRILTASDAESAAGIAEDHREELDLLVTDIVLPGQNGVELSKQLQASIPNLKTLFMSGFPYEESGNHGESFKPVNFIRKPFAIQDFMNLVCQLLHQL
jgi:two-component system cell cycle sensor histidine kinase/response regulator CckA